MAITADEIHNQSFSIDRKGYDVDEVDVFLEHVAEEIDILNATIEDLKFNASAGDDFAEDAFSGFDVAVDVEGQQDEQEEVSYGAVADDATLAEKDARIAELEAMLAEKKANDSAISQALIIAQRSADEIVAKAKAEAANIVQEGKDEAQRVIDRANQERMNIQDAIRRLEDDREDARDQYEALLRNFIEDAQSKLITIGVGIHSPYESAHARQSEVAVPVSAATTGQMAPVAEVVDEPVVDANPAFGYVTPQTGVVAAAAATVVPSAVEKDLSGFGDTDDDFAFDELD